MDKKPVYLCDPEKNESCSKEKCYISGGPCNRTTDKSYEKKQTNQDKLAEMVRMMDPHKLAIFITDAIECCKDCPAEEYCDQHVCVSEDGWNRVPDANGEILDCNQIFERWLKEEA